MEWSQEQETFYEWIDSHSPEERCASINAVAGSGKTTTLIEAIRRIVRSRELSENGESPLVCTQRFPDYPGWISIKCRAQPGTELYTALSRLHFTEDLKMAVNRKTGQPHEPEPPSYRNGRVWTYKLAKHKQNANRRKIEEWVLKKNDEILYPSGSNNIIYLAYNKHIVEEVTKKLEEDIKSKIFIKTIHAFGRSLLPVGQRGNIMIRNTSEQKSVPTQQSDHDKKEQILEKEYSDYTTLTPEDFDTIIKATCIAQQFGLTAEEFEMEYRKERSAIKSHLRQSPMDDNLVSNIRDSIGWCADDESADYNDMIWIPVIKDLFTGRYGWVFVDEAQDLNMCQIKLIMQIKKYNPDARVVVAGDPCQAIYGFRGALPQNFNSLSTGFQTFPLTTTMRCPISHTQLAAKCLPDGIQMTAHRKDEGIIKLISPEDVLHELLDQIRELPQEENGVKSILVLSRYNKPLVNLAYELIRNDITDVKLNNEDNTFTMIKQLIVDFKKQQKTCPDSTFKDYLTNQRELSVAKSISKKEYNRLIFFEEYFDLVLDWFDEKCNRSVEKLEELVTQLSKDKPARVYLSSTHRSKGDEASYVWILEPENYLTTTFRDERLEDNELKQNLNCLYVALSRCKGTTLTIASDEYHSIGELEDGIERYKDLFQTDS